MRPFLPNRSRVAIAALGFFLAASAGWAEGDTDSSDLRGSGENVAASLQTDEFLRTDGVRLFVLRKYEEALAEFKALEAKHPDVPILRRYLGATLAELRRDDEAVHALRDLLRSFPSDLPAHKLLAKIHLRRGEYPKAREHLLKLIELDPSGRFSAYAKPQLEQLEIIETAKEHRQAGDTDAAGRLSPQEFLKTRAAAHFMDARYEDAVKELEVLERESPGDVRVKRYKGIALDRLGRYDEAIAVFHEGLKVAPENTAIRYALAQALFHKRDIEGSQAELKHISASVVASDYKMKADRDLEAIETLRTAVRRAAPKPWSIYIEQGIEFNSNAASEPKKRRVEAEEHAARWPGSVYGNLELKTNGPWALSASYGHSHAFYSDTLDYLNTVAETPSLTLSHLGQVAERPFLTIFTFSYLHVSVEDEFYYQSYPQTLRLISSFWDWHRIVFTERIAWTDYKDQGETPAETSREATSNVMNVANTFYLNAKRDVSIGIGYEFKVEDAEGSNYVRNTHQASADFNFPVWNWGGAVSFRYKNSDYPETVRGIQRLDEEYVAGAKVVVPLTPDMSIRFYYDYLNNNSNDPIYNYINHSGGFSIVRQF